MTSILPHPLCRHIDDALRGQLTFGVVFIFLHVLVKLNFTALGFTCVSCTDTCAPSGPPVGRWQKYECQALMRRARKSNLQPIFCLMWQPFSSLVFENKLKPAFVTATKQHQRHKECMNILIFFIKHHCSAEINKKKKTIYYSNTIISFFQ